MLNDYKINLRGVSADIEQSVREMLVSLINVVAEKIDMTGLDGVTFAFDYSQALLELDRGYDSERKLIPSSDHGIGIAMSPYVFRDGKLKTHIVINAEIFFTLLTSKRSDMAINTVAHECAHVELNRFYDLAFPGVMLQRKENFLDKYRTECMLACWNEFGACWRSASFGPSSPLAYEDAFLPALKETRPSANAVITEYRIHGDISIVTNRVCELYGNLLKYSAYHLGNLHGLGIEWRAIPTTADALKDHWFLPYFERLDIACRAIAADLGNWKDSDSFDALRDIAEDLVAHGGMHFKRHEDDQIGLDIPMTPETTPVSPYLWGER